MTRWIWQLLMEIFVSDTRSPHSLSSLQCSNSHTLNSLGNSHHPPEMLGSLPRKPAWRHQIQIAGSYPLYGIMISEGKEGSLIEKQILQNSNWEGWLSLCVDPRDLLCDSGPITVAGAKGDPQAPLRIYWNWSCTAVKSLFSRYPIGSQLFRKIAAKKANTWAGVA